MKLWAKSTGTITSLQIEQFTVGKDRELDSQMAEFDVIGSLAHIQMLQSIGLLTQEEYYLLQQALRDIYTTIKKGQFIIEETVEDVHSQIELLLTQKLGDTGKKIHSGRSRNDQVLLDVKLFLREQIRLIVHSINTLFSTLLTLSDTYKDVLLPGYTHFQIAMPSSFGLWFGAYAESLMDDLIQLQAAYRVVNKNPLGSAAGYGSSFPLNRQMTTELLGFDTMNVNVVYAQMGRGKTERITAQALASVAATIAKLAMDITLYMNQNFGFISFPDEITTGSSIMPHKKNPDVFELVRAHCNCLQALPNDIILLNTNLPSGYHRDFQLLKEQIFPAFQELLSCLSITNYALSQVHVRRDILEDPQYRYLFSVEEVNRKVLAGIPFRDAYQQVAEEIQSGNFSPTMTLNHSHEGSIGNLCNETIRSMMNQIFEEFHFYRIDAAIEILVGKKP